MFEVIRLRALTTDRFDMKICLRENTQLQKLKYAIYLFLDLTVDKMLQCFCNLKANRSIKKKLAGATNYVS
jgi:poly(3-hydroxyalkanoate) synthetase